MPKTRQQKEVVKERLEQEFKNAKSVIFADYQGLTVVQADRLRAKAREANVDYIVAKKSLFTRAAKAAGIDLDAKTLPGMLGAAFGIEDEVAPAKVLGDIGKKTTLKLVGGIFEGQIVDKEKVIALSKLPSKKELLGMLVGTLYAPVSAYVRVLNAIAEKKGKPEESASTQKAEVEVLKAAEVSTEDLKETETPAPEVVPKDEAPAAESSAASATE